MVFELTRPDLAAPLFAGWDETIIWSCLQKRMGSVFANSPEAPSSAMALLGDFCFLAGDPNSELILYKPAWCKQDFMIMVPHHEAWADRIRACYGEKAKKVTRYAMKKEPDVFDAEKLRAAVNALPAGYVMKEMDQDLFDRCKGIPWCRDWVSQYENYAAYQKNGLGVVILKDGEPVSGASSYSGYSGGIEIEIDTKKEYQRKGLAFACGAGLILKCLERNWYPSWDAQNWDSAQLAEKLGYHFDHEYAAYEIWGY